VTVTGCDIAWQKPTGAQLAAAGIHFASLYVGQDTTGKNMTPAVVADYAAHGVAVIANFEYGAQQMLGGAPQGAVDAALGLQQARACGMPAGRPIIYSADWAATAAQITGAVIPYLVAARGVTGPGTVGVYGSYAVVTAVSAYWAAHFPGERVFLWQTVAWSNSRWAQLGEVQQTGGTITVGGIALDLDYAPAGDVGQWIPGEDMPLTTQDVKAVADEVLGRLIPRAGGQSGPTSLGGMVAWNDAHVQNLANQVSGVKDAIAASGAPVDVKALAVSLAAAVQPAIVAAVQAGIAPEADQLAVTFEQHLASTFAQAK
jgi:hypothetical protein